MTLVFNRSQNPNEACRTPVFMTVPVNTSVHTFKESDLGPIGIKWLKATKGSF